MKTSFPAIPLLTTLLTTLLASPAHSATPEFQSCLANLQERARQQSFPPHAIATIGAMEQQQQVLELDRKQPEFTQTFGKYLANRLTNERIRKGRELYIHHRAFLDQLSRQYGVPGQYLVAFWGLETNFGSYLGNMPTLDSLATLACDPRRDGYFTSEFLTALRVMEREALQPEQMRGSWAGAMGHTQFMPSNYLKYAIDGDGDGRKNLWSSERDALASAANFLSQIGWQRDFRWGREVVLPQGFDYSHAGRNNGRPIKEWREMGVRGANGTELPPTELTGSILVPAGHRGPAFLIYGNFAVIMKWNRSENYAISVGLLADRIVGGGGLLRPPPADQRPLAKAEVEKLQVTLNQLGYDAGEPDGVFGSGTRKALSAFQRDKGLISDGYPDPDVLRLLLN